MAIRVTKSNIDKTQLYIDKAKEKHGDKYDYTLLKDIRKRDCKVDIICSIHGSFNQSLHKHISGDGCKACGLEILREKLIQKSKEKFIKQASELHNNKYKYSKTNYISAKENIIITCPIHGDFYQTPNRHLSGGGCKKCANDKVKERMSIPWNKHKVDLQKIHERKYDYSKVIWKGINENIIVVCPIHGDFEIRPSDHKRGRGCQKCSRVNKIQYNKLDTEKFIEKSIQIWGIKYDYSKTKYIGAKDKICIICNEHGDFEQTPSNHYRYGCPSCGCKENKRNNELKEECKKNFETKSNIVHNNFYDYTKSEYINAITKVCVICKEHGEFYISPNNHLRGNGCPKCGKIKSSISKIKSYEEYHSEFIKIHGNKYDYSSVKWKGSSFPISVVCHKHGMFNILPYNHKKGKGCSKCTNQYSKISIDWLSFMEIKYKCKIIHACNDGEYLIPKSRYKVDGYSETINTVFEFHGDFWHGNPIVYNKDDINPKTGCKYNELYKKTIEKEQFIKNSGYNLVVIWEKEWKNFINVVRKIQITFKSNLFKNIPLNY